MGLFGRGIAFNNSFIRRAPMRPPMMRGPMPGPMGPISFSYSESYSSKTNGWDFMTTLLQTFAMTSMMFGGWGASRASSTTSTPQGTTEQKAEDKCLSNLVDFYGKKFIIKAHPSRDGIYQAVPKDGGAVIEGTYDQLMDELGTVKSEPTAAPTAAPTDAPTAAPTDAPTDAPTAAPTVAPSRGRGRERVRQGAGEEEHVDPPVAGSQKEWTDAEKAKPYTLEMLVAIKTMGTDKASVVTPDGKTYMVHIEGDINALGAALKNKLAGAGWRNITLVNKTFNWSSDGQTDPAGEVDKPEGADKWDAAAKAHYNKPHKISFAISVMRDFSGSATVTTPDGKQHQVTVGGRVAWPWSGASLARKELVKKMISELKADGWTNATVTNSNWPEDCT